MTEKNSPAAVNKYSGTLGKPIEPIPFPIKVTRHSAFYNSGVGISWDGSFFI